MLTRRRLAGHVEHVGVILGRRNETRRTRQTSIPGQTLADRTTKLNRQAAVFFVSLLHNTTIMNPFELLVKTPEFRYAQCR